MWGSEKIVFGCEPPVTLPTSAFAEHKADIRQYGPTLEEIRRDPIRGVTVRDADFTAK
jgi:hypothetical protein